MANYRLRSLDSEASPYLSLEIICSEWNRKRAADRAMMKRIMTVMQFILILLTLPLVLVGILLRSEIPLGVLIAGCVVLGLVWLLDVAWIRLNAGPDREYKAEDYRMLKLPLPS